MRKIFWFLLLIPFLGMGNNLAAEVELVTVTWNAFKCQSTCVSQIQQQLLSIQAVEDLSMSASGNATMKWNSNYPFSYEPFRYASAAVGIHLTSMRVRVKGSVKKEGANFYLVSDKDNTRFFLIGPLLTQPGRYAPSSIETHPLTPYLKDQLTELSERRTPVVIEGPLLLPSHYTLALIAEQIKSKEKK